MSKSVSKLRKARKTTQKTINTDEVFKSNFERPDIHSIRLNDELRSFIPALKAEELTLLEQSIRNEGVRDALLVWKDEGQDYILVDGYNRFHIIKKLLDEGIQVRYNIKALAFDDLEAVKDWMIINQLGRRNLTDEQRSYLRGLRYQREKERHGGDRRSSDQNDHLKTSARLASEYKVGEATIRRDSEFAVGLDKVGQFNPHLKRAILDGEARVNKSVIREWGKTAAQDTLELQDTDDIVKLVSKEKKAVIQKKPENLFSSTRDEIIKKMKKLSNQSKAKDIHHIRTMLDKLEQMLK